MSELVRYEVAGPVATVSLDSPKNRNALSAQLMAELLDGLAKARDDDAVRVVVLGHEGPVFCAGADLKESAGTTGSSGSSDSRGSADIPVATLPAVLQALCESPKPVIARVAGPARAGGIGLLAACDIAVVGDDATFAFTEVRLGVVPAVISAVVLPRLAPQAAHELFLTGEVFTGDRAAQIGLVNRSVPDYEIDEVVKGYVDMLMRGAPGALAATKALLRRTQNPVSADDFAELSALSVRHFGSAEGREGMAAFAEKRNPSWVPPSTR